MATVHNPTNFEPRDYEVFTYLDNRPFSSFGDMPLKVEIEAWQAEMSAVLGADWRKKAFHCVHCGNGRVRWITAVKHIPTGEIVVFGADCTKRLGFADQQEFKLAQLQARDEARKVRFQIWKKRQAFLAENPAIADALAHIEEPQHAVNSFAKDVLRKLDQYGSLSPRQVETVLVSLQRDNERAAATKVEAVEVKGDAPTGRVEVTGTVLSTKIQEGQFGSTLKMLVKLANNSRVWVSVPRKETIERGNTVRFTATFTLSKDDKSFAFGSRPTVHAVSN